MEEVAEDPKEMLEDPEVSKNMDLKNGGPMQVLAGATEGPSESQPEDETEKSTDRMMELQRDLLTLLTNIQTAADAKESMRRAELEEARRIRSERLENDVRSSQEKFEEITAGWAQDKQKQTPQELQEALNKQQQMCAELIEDKRRLIYDLQQELKCGDDRYVKDLRRQAEELDLMIERMEDHVKTITKAYRDELAQIESVYQEERDVLLTKDRKDWERSMKDLGDKQQARLRQRRKTVEEYEAKIHDLIMATDNYSLIQGQHNAKMRDLERELQQMNADSMIMNINHIKQKDDPEMDGLTHIKSRILSLQTELKNLTSRYSSQEKHFTKRNWCLSEDYKRNVQQYEQMQKKTRHFAVADAKQFQEMWQMIEPEVKHLAHRALHIDSLIFQQHLGLPWQRPSPASALLEDAHGGLSPKEWDSNLETDSAGLEAAGQEGELEEQTVKEVMELLCEESSFLMEENLVKLLATMEKDEQTVVKLGTLLHAFGIDEDDIPKLAEFLLKYKDPEDINSETGDKSDGAEASCSAQMTSDLINPKNILPALKAFLKQYRLSSAPRRPSYWSAEVRDASEDEAYWESLGNIIPEDRIRLWDAAENILQQHLGVLTEISECIPETENLRQQNAELRILLHQALTTRVSTELEGP